MRVFFVTLITILFLISFNSHAFSVWVDLSKFDTTSYACFSVVSNVSDESHPKKVYAGSTPFMSHHVCLAYDIVTITSSLRGRGINFTLVEEASFDVADLWKGWHLFSVYEGKRFLDGIEVK